MKPIKFKGHNVVFAEDQPEYQPLPALKYADGDVVKIEVINAATPAKSKTYAAGVVLQIDVTTALGGATNYADLFGYLVNAQEIL